jgi:ATP-dependent Clp protease protease subunit
MEIKEYFKEPRINLTGIVDEKMIEDLDRQIKNPEISLNKQVVLTLTTMGGSMGYARAIYSELGLLQNYVDLTFVARGICMSAGVTIAMAIPHERRLATPDTKFLIHEGFMPTDPDLHGSFSVREIQMDALERSYADDKFEEEWSMKLISKGCKQPIGEVRKQAKSGIYIVGQKAVEFGLVNSLVGKK